MHPLLIVRIFLPFATGYFLSYVFRTVNAVIAPDLRADLGLDAASLGLLTSAYFVTFAAFQLPLGVLLDRYGPRRVEAGLLLIAAAGATLFALGDGLMALTLARGLIGLGVSACLMASFKSFVQWFPAQRLPLVNGFVMAAGGLGALVATSPVEAALELTDWRGVFIALAILALLVSAALILVAPEHPDGGSGGETLARQLQGLASILRSPQFWRIAPLTTVSQASFLSIQGLWAGPWLRDVAQLERAEVADALFWIAAAMVAGFLSLGGLAERLTRAGLRPLSVAIGGMCLFMTVQAMLIFDAGLAPLWVWIGFGFAGTSGILPYAVLSQSFPRELAGRCNTSLNLLVFVSAFAGQWGIGAIVNQWPQAQSIDTGIQRYGETGYDVAFGLALALQMLAMTWFFWSGRGAGATAAR